VKIPENSAVVGKRVKEIDLPPDSMICLVVGKWGVQMTTDSTIIEPDSQVVVVIRPEAEEALRAVLAGSKR